jgi:hypothetical protein
MPEAESSHFQLAPDSTTEGIQTYLADTAHGASVIVQQRARGTCPLVVHCAIAWSGYPSPLPSLVALAIHLFLPFFPHFEYGRMLRSEVANFDAHRSLRSTPVPPGKAVYMLSTLSLNTHQRSRSGP